MNYGFEVDLETLLKGTNISFRPENEEEQNALDQFLNEVMDEHICRFLGNDKYIKQDIRLIGVIGADDNLSFRVVTARTQDQATKDSIREIALGMGFVDPKMRTFETS